MTTSFAGPIGVGDWDRDVSRRSGVASSNVDPTSMLAVPSDRQLKINIRFSSGILVLYLESEPPAWLKPTARSLVELLDLPFDWDSYGAPMIEASHVEAALRTLLRVMQRDTCAPTVVPTNRGGVQLEWHTGGIDLEVETLSMQKLLVSFEDSGTGDDWEKEIISDFAPLVRCIKRLP